MALKQDDRSIGILTALGKDAVGLRSFTIQETLGRLFQIEAELSSEDPEIKFDQVVGHNATIRLETGQKPPRYFNGFVSRFVQVADARGYAHYRATLVPWLWFLTRTAECRVWVAVEEPAKGKTIPQIIEDVFKAYGFSDYKLDGLSRDYAKKEFCVQYRETAFNFVSRLMEQEGIYYFFKHEDGKHTLMLADSISAHAPSKGYKEVTFDRVQKRPGDQQVVTDWVVEKEAQPVSYVLNDFDFIKPKTSLLAPASVSRKHGGATYEIYDYPGEYLDTDEGERLAGARLDELQASHEVLRGQTSARGLATGCTFQLKAHPRSDQNREYLITGVSLHAEAGEFAAAGSSAAGATFFSCSFTAIDKTQQFRPARLTPKPVEQGLQTAIVVGPKGEEIHTDEHGRVKVQFHWDRYGKADENSSCWLRVSQSWAGKQWGAIHIPRIGQEVIVEFLEGDPDRPLITGRVYNGDQTPPYDLPANKTQSGIKSRSTKQGSVDNFNEIRFEDKKGSEQLYIHAEKDKQVVVENDRTEQVGHDESISIGNNRTESVDKDESITIGNNRTEDVGKSENITIGETRTTDVGKEDKLTVGDKQTVSVGKDQTIEITDNRSLTVGKDETITVSGSRKEDVTKDAATKAGKTFVLEAGDEIMIQTGSASVSMKKDGTIAIKGKDISIEGSGKIQIKASSDLILKGSKITQN